MESSLTNPIQEIAPKIIALVDGNSFYCSCERVFEPRLNQRPVIVLSNNDGCTISRTAEAKALGIPMAAPYFKIRELCKSEGVAVFSSNYTLYGDMSRRMNEVYHHFTPDVEVYSIDESFLDLTGLIRGSPAAYGQEIRSTVKQWTGIPTCVGLGPTKTLAKLANWTAKNFPELDGVCDYTDPSLRERMMALIPASRIWGVGHASALKLSRLGIKTAADFRDADPERVRKALSVIGARMVWELRGVSCLPLDLAPGSPKSCAVTRSFGRAVTRLEEMREAVASYATRAGEKLRRSRLAAANLLVFMRTNRFNRDPRRSVSASLALPEPSNDTRRLIAAALDLTERLWKEGFRYSKAGVILTELAPTSFVQRPLFGDERGEQAGRSENLMKAIDAINRRHGRGTLYPAAAGMKRAWAMRNSHRSPAYTTEIRDLPIAVADTRVVGF